MKPEVSQILNSSTLWLMSSVMIIVILVQAVLFLRAATAEARRIDYPKANVFKAIRAAAISSIGPSLGPVVILIALIAVLGAPTAWMRVNDIGAARTELAVATMTAKFVNAQPGTASYTVDAFSYSLWGMALNNVMWILVALLFTSRMHGMVAAMNRKYHPTMVKMIMNGAALGLFGMLLCGQIVGTSVGKVSAAIAAAVAMLIIVNVIARKVTWMREPSLGLAMMVGMAVAVMIVGK
jgi:hypothetical protein